MDIDIEKTVLVVALPQEVYGNPIIPLEYLGCGKVNATIQTCNTIFKYRPNWIINYGSAGSRTIPQGELVNITTFYQRDMNATVLNFGEYETPYDTQGGILRIENELGEYFTKDYSCGTGDNFVTSDERSPWDVVDMEAYAIAKTCKAFGIKFSCIKYISDGADSNSDQDWSRNLKDGWNLFTETFLKFRL